MAKPPTIDELVAMDDSSLMEVFGFTQKLKAAKEDLKELATLGGKAREDAEERVANMLTPNIYPSDFQFIYEDVTRKNKDGQAELDDPTPAPASVL